MRRTLVLAMLLASCKDASPPSSDTSSTVSKQVQVFAASYSMSDGYDLKAQLDLAADGRFTFMWEGCMGLIAQAAGHYTADDDVIRMAPESEEFERDPRTFSEVMYRVHWSDREYLVSEARMLEFINAINAGLEPRSGAGVFYLRAGDEEKPVHGHPTLESRWSEYLLPSPLAGTVIRVEQRETATQRPIIVIDAGANAGLRKGMRLFARNPRRPNFKADLTVLSVEPESAIAQVDLQVSHVRVCDVWKSRLSVDAVQADPRDDGLLSSCLAQKRRS
jgi:hypothetical protein